MVNSQETIAALKKHHFWIIAGLAAVVALVGWFMGTGNVAAEHEKNTRDRMNHVQSVQNLDGGSPNATFPPYLNEKTQELTESVYEGWKDRFEVVRPLLYGWPDWMDESYIIQINNAILEGKEIEESLRFYYKENLRDEFSNLYHGKDAKLDLREPIEGEKGPGGAAGLNNSQPDLERGGRDVAYAGVVAWSPSERQKLEELYGKSWTSTPSTAQMIFTQQVINVYAAVLEQVVNKTNDGIAEHHKAHLKKIVSFVVGAEATLAPSTDTNNSADVADSTDRGSQAKQRNELLKQLAPQRRLEGAMQFVDAQNQPVPDPRNQPFAEFRILPIKLRLIMDQRRIPDLIANMANSDLKIQVLQVNLEAVQEKDGAADTGARMDIFGGLPEIRNQEAKNKDTANEFDKEVVYGPYDVDVEVYGNVFLFNPPDQKKVGSATAQEDGQPAEAGDATTGESPTSSSGAAGDGSNNGAPPTATPSASGEAVPATPAEPAPAEGVPGS